MVDKNLFLYDLAIVAIMKAEEPYVKEWINYHLLAGVDHFYIYDNDSTPEFKKILQPYIDADIVTYTPIHGQAQQMTAYNDALKRFKFESRYIAYIDGDEFIFPKSKPTIIEVLDEVLPTVRLAAGLSMQMSTYGSNGLEKADYTKDVLDRFTMRDANLLDAVKSIVDPRTVDFFWTAHFPSFFDEHLFALSDAVTKIFKLNYAVSEKIVLNHYHVKSREEYENKIKRGDVAFHRIKLSDGSFKWADRNDVFDDGIIKYRDERRDALIGKESIETLFARKQINSARLFNALAQNLVSTTVESMSRNFYAGKVENFLTCLHLSGYLRGKLLNDTGAKFFEELSLRALLRSLQNELSLCDVLLLFDEMPRILKMNYPDVKKILSTEIQLIEMVCNDLMKNIVKDSDLRIWNTIIRLRKSNEILKSFSL